MSTDYSLVQKSICDIKTGAPETEEAPIKYCPTCIIDENAPKKTWWNETEPYLNKRTCEYYVPVNINAEGKTYTTAELRGNLLPFNIFKYSYLRTGIRKVLRHYNKIDNDAVVCAKLTPTAAGLFSKPKEHLYVDKTLWPYLGKFYKDLYFKDDNGNDFKVQEVRDKLVEQFPDITNPDALELFARVEDYHLGTGMQVIKMLVVIPAYVFDQIPENPLGRSLAEEDEEEEEEEEEEEYQLLEEIEIDAYKFKKNIKGMSAVFEKWATYQALFYNVQGGRIKQLSLIDKEKEVNFYIKKYKKPLEKFRGSLEELLKENDFLLTKDKKQREAAEKIKITFKLPTKSKPYRIEKVEARYKNCDYKHCAAKEQAFLDTAWVKHPVVLNYIAKVDESSLALSVMKNAPWLDWVEKYTYPKVQMNYSGNAEQVAECIELPPDTSDVDDQILDVDLDFGKLLEWFMSQMNCKSINDMRQYDPITDLEKMRNKFGKLLDKKLFTQNDFIKELFGLPIDWKAVGKKSALETVSDFFERATLCNVSVLLFEILKCLFGTFSLEEMFGIIIERILLAAGIPAFKLVFEATPSVFTDLAAEKAKLKLAFEKTPWEYYDEKLLEDKDAGKYLIWLAGVDEKAEGLGERRGLGGGENPPQPNIEKVFNEWLKQYLDSLDNFDLILDMIKGFPGAGILKILIAVFACPNQSVLKKFLSELKGILNFGAINPFCPLGEAIFKLPTLPKIPKMSWKELLRMLLMILIKKLIDLIAALLLSILLKLLMQLSCDSLRGFLDALANGWPSDKALEEAVGESFCPDEDEEGDGAGGAGGAASPTGNSPALDTLLDLLDDQGVIGPPEDIMPLAADISGCAGKDEFKKAFITPPDEQDPDFCNMIATIINDRHPKFIPILGSPEDVGFFFSGIGNFLTPIQKTIIADTITGVEDDEPIDSSICLTKEQKRDWNKNKRAFINNLCGNLPMDGFRAGDLPGAEPPPDPGIPDAFLPATEDDLKDSPTLADDWLDKINEDRAPDALADAMDLFINGPAAGIGAALEEALDMAAPNCRYDPETGEPIESDEPGAPDNKSIIPPLPEEITSMVDEAKKTAYSTIENSFTYDLIGGYNSVFNHLFADTYNHTFYSGRMWRPSHKTAVRHGWMYPNAAHTMEQWQEKWDGVKERTFSIKKLLMKMFAPETDTSGTELDFDSDTVQFPSHVYPETVSIWMRSQMLDQAELIMSGGFATDMDMGRAGGTVSVTPVRYDLVGNEKDYNYKKRGKWDIKKKVTYTFFRKPVPKPEMEMKFRDNNSGLGGWSYGFNLKLINYDVDDGGNQLAEPSYRLILDELDSTNVPSGASWLTRARSVEDDGTIALKGIQINDDGEIEVLDGIPSTVKRSRDRYFNVGIKTDPGNALNILPLYSEAPESELASYNFSGIVFKNYVNSVYEQAGLSLTVADSYLAQELFDGLNNYVYGNVLNTMLNHEGGHTVSELEKYNDGVPESFMFGYVDDRITKADLTYVTPTASVNDEDTWEYDHDNDEMILGKSATEHPRVEFLDPEIHGGRYTRPKIYISPPPYTGWLGLSQIIIPEEDNHEPKRKVFIFTDEVAKKEKDLREIIPYDERLNDDKQCLQERAYDILNEQAGHAGLHSSVVLTARLYAFEHMLKSMSMYNILKVDFRKNYDESVLAAVVEDMEEQMMDIPSRGRRKGYYKGYNYWLLFLEQSVQTVERMVLTDEIEMTPALAEQFEELKSIRESMAILKQTDIKWLKYVSKISWDDSGEISNLEYAYTRRILGIKKKYPLEASPSENQDRRVRAFIEAVMFYSLGKGFKAILSGEEREFAYRMRRRQRNMFKMANKLYAIHKTKEFAKSFLRYIIANQLEFYSEKFNEFLNPKPLVADLRKFFFGSGNIIIAPLNGGLTSEEEAGKPSSDPCEEAEETEEQVEETTFDYGANIKNVVKDPQTENPTMFFDADEKAKLLDESPFGNFYFEKYLRIVEKPEPKIRLAKTLKPGSKQSVVNDRDDSLKGVVNIEEFQGWLSQNLAALTADHTSHSLEPPPPLTDPEEEPTPHPVRISDLFGDAEPVYEYPTEDELAAAEARGEDPPQPKLIDYEGSTGIKFGVRLCFVPPSGFDPTLSFADTAKEKSFLFAVDPDGEFLEHNTTKIFPIASYERDIIDGDILDLNLNDDNFGEELNCYVDELIQSPEVSLLFDYCFPLRRASSLMSTYCNYAFIPSIGEDITERDVVNGRTPTQAWKGRIFKRSKHRLRRIFASNYRATAWSTFMIRDDQDPRDKMRRNWKLNFSINLPSLAFTWAGWRIGRRVIDRPYDMCGNPEEVDDGVS